MPSIQHIVIDIEGTVSPVSFVKDVLYPYSRERIARFILRDEHPEPVRKVIDAAVKHAIRTFDDRHTYLLNDIEMAYAFEHWIDRDEKHTALKTIQGLIWKKGYADGTLVSELYPDVVPTLTAWKAAGYHLHIYSSGSIEAQQDFFQHTKEGDVRHFFEHYFDTTTGHKKEAASYTAILKALGVPMSESQSVLFLSDIIAELDAAAAAGLRTTQLKRPDNTMLLVHPQAADMTEVVVE
jgi:enolase-phosphatase E1